MPSLVFDRAASFYDQTRLLPAPMEQQGVPALLALAQGAPVLEVGAGTGRISVPLLERGANLFGCDLSRPMMAHLQAKHPAARLAQADALRLPFADGTFHMVFTAHVLHLVSGWQNAVREFRRVLRPAGVYVNSWTIESPDSFYPQMRDYWRVRVEAHGAQWRRPGIETREELLTEAQRLGAQVETLELGTTPGKYTGYELIESLANRISSDTWSVPDEVLALTLTELRAWAETNFGAMLAKPGGSSQHVLDVIRF